MYLNVLQEQQALTVSPVLQAAMYATQASQLATLALKDTTWIQPQQLVCPVPATVLTVQHLLYAQLALPAMTPIRILVAFRLVNLSGGNGF